MPSNKTVDVNGRTYDRVTGMPINRPAKADEPKQRSNTAAHSVHASTQRSQTLHRRSTKKPGPPKRPQPGRLMDVSRSRHVSRYAEKPTTAAAPVTPKPAEKPDAAAKTHPIAKRAASKKPAVATTAKQTKNAAIAEALAAPKAKSDAPKQMGGLRWSRRASVVLGLCIVLIIAGIITYLNLPTISVAVASSQANVDASYPKYKPDGYTLIQPVSFKSGEVSLTFQSNTNDSEYVVTQASSSWDSSAVLDNIVKKSVGENYATNQERGLTIYTYKGNAAWVTGGVLYTITGDAPLSTDQVLRIATSLT